MLFMRFATNTRNNDNKNHQRWCCFCSLLSTLHSLLSAVGCNRADVQISKCLRCGLSVEALCYWAGLARCCWHGRSILFYFLDKRSVSDLPTLLLLLLLMLAAAVHANQSADNYFSVLQCRRTGGQAGRVLWKWHPLSGHAHHSHSQQRIVK